MTSRTWTFTVAMGLTLAFGAGWPNVGSASGENISKVTGSISVAASDAVGNLNTVNGSIDVGANARSGNISTVNGSIKLADGARTGQLSTVNGSIRGSRDNHAGTASTVNGQIFFDRGSQVRGDVGTVNGAIGLVGTRIDGGIDITNGDLTVGANSHVLGGIHYGKPGRKWFSFGGEAPRIVIGPDAQVDGALVFEREVHLYVHDSARIGAVTGATAQRYTGARPPGRD